MIDGDSAHLLPADIAFLRRDRGWHEAFATDLRPLRWRQTNMLKLVVDIAGLALDMPVQRDAQEISGA